MRRVTQFPQVLILIATLMLLGGLPLAAAEEAVEAEAVEVAVEQDLEAAGSQELEEIAAWGGPEAPMTTAIRAEFESGSDCDSSQGYCSSSAQCWSFCRALTGEIGFCNQIYNCCVCPEIPF